VLADFKAEYQLSEKWQLIASVINILDQRDFGYTIVDDLNTYHTSYKIRPRNLLLSLYYKF
jgi:outer membrane receptor for ferrienterochelin and colicin